MHVPFNVLTATISVSALLCHLRWALNTKPNSPGCIKVKITTLIDIVQVHWFPTDLVQCYPKVGAGHLEWSFCLAVSPPISQTLDHLYELCTCKRMLHSIMHNCMLYTLKVTLLCTQVAIKQYGLLSMSVCDQTDIADWCQCSETIKYASHFIHNTLFYFQICWIQFNWLGSHTVFLPPPPPPLHTNCNSCNH